MKQLHNMGCSIVNKITILAYSVIEIKAELESYDFSYRKYHFRHVFIHT